MQSWMKDWAKTILPLWALGFIFEVLTLLAWTGPYLKVWQMAVVYVTPYALVGLLGLIPAVRKLVRYIGWMIWDTVNGIKNFPWKKNVIVTAVDALIALLAERMLVLIQDGSFTSFEPRKWIFIFAIVFIASIFICYKDMMIRRIETAVLLIILTIGTTMITVLPTSCGLTWDDETHYYRALGMTHLLDDRMSTADLAVLTYFASTALDHYLYNEEDHANWVEQLDTLYESGEYVNGYRTPPTYSNWCYVPSAVGLIIGRALSLPYHIIFLLGKWFNLLMYAVLIYFALKKLKSGKMIAAVIALLPPSMMMATTYARDPWMMAWIMYGFCYFVGELQEPGKKLTTKDLVMMLGAMVLGVGTKAVYALIILVLLFLPKEKFQSDRQRKIFRIAVCVATVLVLSTILLPFIKTSGASVEDTRGPGVDSPGQTSYILQHPFIFIRNMLVFIREYVSLANAQGSFAWFSYVGTSRYALLLIVLLAVVTFLDRAPEDMHISWKPRVALLMLGVMTVGLVATSMYIAFSPYQSDTVLGCQYRYLLELMFPALFMMGCFPIENRIKKNWYHGIVLSISSFILLNGVWTLFLKGF